MNHVQFHSYVELKGVYNVFIKVVLFWVNIFVYLMGQMGHHYLMVKIVLKLHFTLNQNSKMQIKTTN